MPLGMLEVGASEGVVQGVAPESMAGVMMKVIEEVKEEYWRVVHMDKQGLSAGGLTEIWKPKSLMDRGV